MKMESQTFVPQPVHGRIGLAITGIGMEWPDHLMDADELQGYIEKFYDMDEKWYLPLTKAFLR